jgi:hypothetical protein
VVVILMLDFDILIPVVFEILLLLDLITQILVVPEMLMGLILVILGVLLELLVLILEVLCLESSFFLESSYCVPSTFLFNVGHFCLTFTPNFLLVAHYINHSEERVE